MAKAGYGVKDAVKTSFGITEGNVEFVNVISKVHQYPANSKTGVQSAPFGCVQLELHMLDKDYNRKDEDTVTVELGWGSLEHFHPGNAKNRDDDDPEDLGDEVDVSGNCIYSDGSRIQTTTGWIRFTDSMEKSGFKPEVLGNGFLPDLIGTKCHLHTDTLEKWAGYKKDDPPTQLVVDKIVSFPYDNKKGTAAKPPAKGAAPVKGTAPAPAKKETATDSGDDVTDVLTALATDVLTQIRDENAGKEMDVKSLKSKATAKLMRMRVPVPKHKAIFTLLADPEFLEGAAEALEFAWDADESKLIFAATE